MRGDIAMTGEITLSGRVLPVGGIKEKVLAARRVGIREVILPRQNEKNVNEDLTPELRKGLTVHYVPSVDEVLLLALSPSRDGDGQPQDRPPRAAVDAVGLLIDFFAGPHLEPPKLAVGGDAPHSAAAVRVPVPHLRGDVDPQLLIEPEQGDHFGRDAREPDFQLGLHYTPGGFVDPEQTPAHQVVVRVRLQDGRPPELLEPHGSPASPGPFPTPRVKRKCVGIRAAARQPPAADG